MWLVWAWVCVFASVLFDWILLLYWAYIRSLNETDIPTCLQPLFFLLAVNTPPLPDPWLSSNHHLSFTLDIGSSVQFSCSVVSYSLRPHGLQHARPPCPSPTPGAYSDSCLSSRWCHATISSSVIPFSFRLPSFPASGSFQMSQFFASGGQSIGSFSFSISPSSEHSGLIFRMD